MATHSSILAWRIPWTEEPGGLQSMESQRVGLLHPWDFSGKSTGVGCHSLPGSGSILGQGTKMFLQAAPQPKKLINYSCFTILS